MKLESVNGVTINTDLFAHMDNPVEKMMRPSFDVRGRSRVTRILEQILPFALITPPKLVFALNRISNAFITPTHELVVTDALEREIDTDGALAAILGHEMGHLYLRHPWKKLATLANLFNKTQILSVDEAVVLINRIKSSRLVKVADKVDYNHEKEADQFGFTCAFKAGFLFNEVVQMRDHLIHHDQHPANHSEEGRITTLNKFIDQFRAK